MKYILTFPKTFILLILALIIGSCQKDEVEISYNLSGNWKVLYYGNLTNGTAIFKSNENSWLDINNGDVTVNFSNIDATHGFFSGITVTNEYSGPYSIDEKGGIVLTHMSTTMVGEPEWGSLFRNILNVKNYEVVDDRLILYYNQKKNSIVLVRN